MRNIIFLVIASIFCSCSNEATTIGAGFFSEGSLDIAYIDSSTVKLSTIQIDDIISNTSSRVVVGTHDDISLGHITASAFFKVGLQAAVSLKDMNVEYGFASLVLKYDGYSYYDTTALLTLNAYRVSDNIKPDANGAIYNNDSFEVDPEVLGTVVFNPRPHRDDSIEIVLTESFGRTLFEKAVTAHKDLQSNEEFLNYIRGFALFPDSTVNASFVGFASSSVELRLYYKNLFNVPSTTEHLSFPLTDLYYSSHIHAQRPTYFDQLSVDNMLPSSETGNKSYIEGGCGLALRVDLPYLRELRQNPNFYVTHADLEIYVEKKSFDPLTPLPVTLTVYPVTGKNALYTEIVYTADLVEDDLQRDTRYKLDVTTFIKAQMDLLSFNKNGLMFILPGSSFRSGVDRIYFAEHSSQYKTRLKIYYATINE